MTGLLSSILTDWILPALGLGVPLALAGLATFAVLSIPLPWRLIPLIVLTTAGYLAGWHVNGWIGEGRAWRRDRADLEATIADRDKRLEVYSGLSFGVAKVGRNVSEIISQYAEEQSDAEAVAAPEIPVCLDGDADADRVQRNIDRARKAFVRARAAGASAR